MPSITEGHNLECQLFRCASQHFPASLGHVHGQVEDCEAGEAEEDADEAAGVGEEGVAVVDQVLLLHGLVVSTRLKRISV